MLARKFESRNVLFSLWSLNAGKILVRLDQNEEKINMKSEINN